MPLDAWRERLALVFGMALAATAHAQMQPNNDVGFGIGNAFGGLNPLTGPKPLLAYGADVGVGETDNVTLASSNKISQTMATADVDFAVNQQSRLLEVAAKGAFTDLVYLQGAYGNELIGRFDGLAQAAIIPERLTWVLRDDFGQATLDAFTPITPNELENVNYLSTGPNLSLRLGGTGFLDVSARYANAYYQTSPFDSNRALATVAAGLQLSARSAVSLNAAGERVLFQNTLVNSDFDRYALYGRYEAHGARTDLAVNLGATRVDEGALAPVIEPHRPLGAPTGVPLTVTGQPATTSTSPLARLELARTLSPSAKVILTGGRELTDASSSFSTQTGNAISTTNFAPTPLSTDPYVATYGSLGWQYVRYRTTFLVTGRWERDRYPAAPQFDFTSPSVEFNVQRRLTQAFTAQLIGRWYKYDYPNETVALNQGSAENDTKLIGAALSWRSGRWLEIRLRYEHTTYSVSQGNFGYGQNTVFLTVGYRPRQGLELPEPGAVQVP